MNCKGIDSLLSPYIDGELSGREMRSVREHLNVCATCSAELEVVRMLKSDLTSLPEPDCDEQFEERLVEAVFRTQKRHSGRFKIAFAGGLAFAGAFGIATLWLQSTRVEATEAANQVARSSFELERDQAYLAGGDPLAGNTVVLTSSHGLR
jgi:anti-sigma factor RsiW